MFPVNLRCFRPPNVLVRIMSAVCKKAETNKWIPKISTIKKKSVHISQMIGITLKFVLKQYLVKIDSIYVYSYE